MTSNPSPTDEVHALCERLIEATLTPDERTRLEALVLTDMEARRVYVEYMHLHAALRSQGWAAGRPLTEVLGNAAPGARPPRRRTRAAFYAASLPLMLVLGVIASRMLAPAQAPAPEAVATLSAAKSCRWESATLPTEVGSRLPPGRLKLAAGLATLAFASGATVTLEGPAEIELMTPMSAVLHRGSVIARVPASAVGFTMRSASAVVIDHGTEFGMSADELGGTHVEVLSGLVAVHHPRSGENVRLETGEGAELDATKILVRGPMAKAPERRARPARAPALVKRDLLLTTQSGRGRTGFVQGRPPDPTHKPADPGFMLVKHAVQAAWHRKAYFAIDLTSLHGARVADATLTLTFAPTGLGYATLVPDATFVVYGITDDSIDTWDPAALQWEGAPASASAADAVDLGKATRLGSFVIQQGVQEGAFAVAGERLTDFLNRNTSGVVTFIVVRETKEEHEGGLVHGVVGNEHPNGSPPTLRLTLGKTR